ncbi:tRNA uracil 4-sulfurtransferase ThiI [Virgibacillus soli]|uniref:tRNA uracil 4-sulfurtransferase ThiI n=1 Tax=Paracerasibacillus soli TaxID=480284 RepID=UPI0035EAAD8D
MEFDHILIRYGELALKGRNQNKFLNKLQHNIQQQLKSFSGVKVKRIQGRMFILLNGQDPEPIMNKCQQIFGIHSLSLALKVTNDVEEIKKAALYALLQATHVHTFKVVTKRAHKGFPVGSLEMNQIIGGYLLENSEGITVDVHRPDLEVRVEIRTDATYITSATIPGAGGLPVGTSGKTLLLLSGGIDSPVAGYLTMKRGVELEAIHFHSPPFTSDRAKQKVLDLAEKLTQYGHKIKVHIVPFTKLQQQIFAETKDGYGMTIMRRMMFRISEAVCKQEGILSIATGESLGQVASQTMDSMNTINEVTNYPILRPLVAMDKQEIIKIARKIDTYDISIRPYEDCCTIFVPKAPKTKPKRDKSAYYEAKYNYDALLEETIAGIETITITGQKRQEDQFKDLF